MKFERGLFGPLSKQLLPSILGLFICVALFPASASAYACQSPGFVDTGGGVCQGKLTTALGATWQVPAVWNNSTNEIEVIGPGPVEPGTRIPLM